LLKLRQGYYSIDDVIKLKILRGLFGECGTQRPDLFHILSNKVTRIIVHFKNFTGDYIWHCHRLEHEDHDMMRPLRVIKKVL
jgi:hypothetical protein